MAKDKRVERNTTSVLALRDMLRDVIKDPSSFANHVVLSQSLKSQGELAKFSDVQKDILGTSLNTMKRIADSALEGGFGAIDSLRIAARLALEKESAKEAQSNKVSKVGLAKRVKELEVENLHLRQDLLLLTHAFEKSLTQGRNYALKASSPAVKTLCIREQRVLWDSLSLRQFPVSTNLVKLHEV